MIELNVKRERLKMSDWLIFNLSLFTFNSTVRSFLNSCISLDAGG